MLSEHYFYNCSKEYVGSIAKGLPEDIDEVIGKLPKRNVQAEINADIFWLLTQKSWAYDSMPHGFNNIPNDDGSFEKAISQKDNQRHLCSTSTTLEASWHSDFARSYPTGLVQLEVQFGSVC